MENGELKKLLFLVPLILSAGDLDNIDISLDLGDVDKPYSYKGYIKPEFYYIRHSAPIFLFKKERIMLKKSQKGFYNGNKRSYYKKYGSFRINSRYDR